MSRAVLVVDDDRQLCAALKDALSSPEVEVLRATSVAEGREACRRRQVDVVLLDQQLPDGKGASLCPEILKADEQTKIIFMTAYPSYENAVEAIRQGAWDYVSKPFELEALRLSVTNALRVRELEAVEQLQRRDLGYAAAHATLVGSSAAMDEVRYLASLAAASSHVPVLILGRTGTGKSLLARFIHYSSRRAKLPLVCVNCAALPETLAESEIFGHERGAFTGASVPRRGVFEMAGEGSVLLDEIGAMPLALQAKLLGVLEDRRLRRVGSEVERPVAARVIAATNTELDRAMAAGHFRQDLFFRLNVMTILIPPLRDHLDDLPELCSRLVEDVCGAPRPLATGEIERLSAYDWPGNVRELRNLIERAAILGGTAPLAPSNLLGRPEVPAPAAPGKGTELPTLEEVERQHLDRVLRQLGGNLSQTARAVGISLSTLKRKIRQYGLQR